MFVFWAPDAQGMLGGATPLQAIEFLRDTGLLVYCAEDRPPGFGYTEQIEDDLFGQTLYRVTLHFAGFSHSETFRDPLEAIAAIMGRAAQEDPKAFRAAARSWRSELLRQRSKAEDSEEVPS